jgi:hypothetical protein
MTLHYQWLKYNYLKRYHSILSLWLGITQEMLVYLYIVDS